jgi:hypothetical protein
MVFVVFVIFYNFVLYCPDPDPLVCIHRQMPFRITGRKIYCTKPVEC